MFFKTDSQSDIVAAKNDGKNADSCYEAMIMQLRDASDTVFGQLAKCVDDAMKPLGLVESNIASHITVPTKINFNLR